MTICGIWVKADNGRWFDDPVIGGADWRLDISEFGDDTLFIRANKVKFVGHVPVITPEQLIAEFGLPITVQGGGSSTGRSDLGRCRSWTAITTGKPFPRSVILTTDEGCLNHGKHGTRVGGTA